MFHNRNSELRTLEEEYSSDGFSFVVLYGRRRVGKTELIKKFCEDKPHIYHLVSQDSEKLQREKLIEDIVDYFNERVPRTESWSDAIDYVGEKLSEEKIVLAIDELPYLIGSDSSVLSSLQSVIDENSEDMDSMLILCGSSISVMESDVMGHKSPLYGRRTAQIDLKPFSFSDSLSIIDYSMVDAVRSYSTTGGTPMYLQLFDYENSLSQNLLENHLSKNSVLYNEPEFLLRTELRNPSRYMSILEAIANGHTTPNEISGQTDIGSGPLSNYLQKLRRIRLIERVVPVTADKKKSKRSIYKIKDSFLRFWFRFIEPNRSGIEESPELVLENNIQPRLDRFVSKTYEEVCTEALWKMNRQGMLRDSYSKMGKWWYKEYEIDIVGLNPESKSTVFCECKWTESKVDTDLMRDLENKSDEVRWHNNERHEEYVLFSKSGFTRDLLDEAGETWTLVDIEKLDQIFSASS
ncbi:ATP-binding protein [Halorutilales archaeon Cl-col2-1]